LLIKEVEVKVVVIGGSGFLGSHISDALMSAGYDVTIFDKEDSPWRKDSQKMVIGNIVDEKRVQNALDGAHYVYHLAGVADLNQAAEKPKETFEHNIIGSVNVIEACIRNKVKRLIFASTVYVYSHTGSFYRISKQAVEAMLEAYNQLYGLNYTILRYGSLYGPRAQAWNGLKLFVVQAVKEGRIVYPGTGEELREYIHVNDAARLSVQALSVEFENQCLTLTGAQVMSTADVMKMIREIIGKDVSIEFSSDNLDYQHFHYFLTPYRYTPKRGKKIVPNVFVDLGQGIMELIEEVDNHCCDA